ncbi:MAG: hypothetical protein ABJQ34_20855 [Paracoccaceae bacterium]
MFRTIATMATCLISTMSSAQDVRYQSVWHAGEGRSFHTGFLSLEAFEDSMEELAAEGDLRLIDVETAIFNGARGYAGLWTEGTGGNKLDRVRGLSNLRRVMRVRKDEGLRLTDFEAHRENGQLRYLALFRPGTGTQRMDRPLPIDKFLERKDLFRMLGLELHDVEAVTLNGQIQFIGLYRSDSLPSAFTGFRPRQNFTQLRDRLVSEGWELFDIERIRNAEGDNVYFALWREGDGTSRLSRFRRAGAQFTFSLEQQSAGRQAIDFELMSTNAPDVDAPRQISETEAPQLPPNPSHVTLTDDTDMRIQFTQVGDIAYTMEIPRRWLPEWLPEQNGEVLLPNTFCALSIRKADSVRWQVQGNDAVNEAPFQSTETVPEHLSLGGIHFGGPIGACAGTDTPWSFDDPFTSDDVPFIPLDNMSLVISAVDGELSFLPTSAPHVEGFDPLDLFTTDTEESLSAVLNAFEGLFVAHERIDNYCEVVGGYWKAICVTSPNAECPSAVGILPDCALP